MTKNKANLSPERLEVKGVKMFRFVLITSKIHRVFSVFSANLLVKYLKITCFVPDVRSLVLY